MHAAPLATEAKLHPAYFRNLFRNLEHCTSANLLPNVSLVRSKKYTWVWFSYSWEKTIWWAWLRSPTYWATFTIFTPRLNFPQRFLLQSTFFFAVVPDFLEQTCIRFKYVSKLFVEHFPKFNKQGHLSVLTNAVQTTRAERPTRKPTVFLKTLPNTAANFYGAGTKDFLTFRKISTGWCGRIWRRCRVQHIFTLQWKCFPQSDNSCERERCPPQLFSADSPFPPSTKLHAPTLLVSRWNLSFAISDLGTAWQELHSPVGSR